MTEHYLDRLARTITENWDQPALTDFYLTEDGSAQDTSRGNHYTYGEMYAEMLRLGELFHSIGLQKGDHIAICGANSAHWVIAYLAIAAYQSISVTVMQGQSREDIAHQIDFSDAKVLFADIELWKELQSLPIPQVEHVVCLEDWSILLGQDIQIHNRESIITNREANFDHDSIDELAHICFTSGTTGNSKGVMLSFGNISNAIQQTYNVYIKNSKDVKKALSIIPLAHIYGLGGHLIPLICGVSIFIITKLQSFQLLIDKLCVIQPNIIFTVPAVAIKVTECNKSEWKKTLVHLVIGGADFSILQEQKLRSLQIPAVRVYGTTETSAPISMSSFEEQKIGSSGRIIETSTIRIDPAGEILVKGENVMLGYYKDPEATARKIDKDGWLHTGDKGHLDEDGYLYVEGRLEQDMIVLPNGENIHPEDIERKINALPEVKESIVLARDGRLVAIVVPSRASSESSETRASSPSSSLRRHVLRTVNPELPLYSQLYDVEITDTPLAKTEKQTIKRYLYK